MKILLITTPKEGECVEGATPAYLLYDFSNYPPLGLLAIAANVDSRHELEVLDTVTKNMSIAETVEYIKKAKPDLLGLSVASRRLYPMKAVTARIKEELPDTAIIVGGAHPNEFGMQTMELGTMDYVMSGYCELAFPQFIENLDKIRKGEASKEIMSEVPGLYYRLDGQIKFNPEDEKAQSLDHLPFPKRDLVDLNDYFTAADKERMTTMFTSRGCPYKCTFCDVTEKQYHYRSTKMIVDEMEYILSLGIKEIHIFDDTFNLNRKRVIEMCNEIIRRGVKVRWTARVRANPLDREMLLLMKKAGLSRLHAGIESLDPAALIAMKKQITLEHIKDFFALCKELKINTLCYMILGFPEETREYRETFFKTLKKLSPTYVFINVLYPLAKTKLYDDLVANGFYPRDLWDDFFRNPVPNFELPPMRTPELQKEVVELMDNVHKRFYLSPSFIIQDLRRNMNPKMLMRKAKMAMRLIFANTLQENANGSHHSSPFPAKTSAY
ncbi:MAG: hypothetical protein COV66_10675 [Nitrospinae bacterium CG11_big_fil_rev_8_21_14_0_20_45_15]|nr:MAG: hypothetical protein COV66_10675 [Nitrospinae bacterium CG11_big_fil_rev_8_21_14_0_20_45_15]